MPAKAKSRPLFRLSRFRKPYGSMVPKKKTTWSTTDSRISTVFDHKFRNSPTMPRKLAIDSAYCVILTRLGMESHPSVKNSRLRSRFVVFPVRVREVAPPGLQIRIVAEYEHQKEENCIQITSEYQNMKWVFM